MTPGIAALGTVDDPLTAERRWLRILAPAGALVALLALLATFDVAGAGAAWNRAHIAVAYVAALIVALAGSGRAEGRERQVRGWTALGIAIFLAAELLRDVESVAGIHLAVDPADAALPALVTVVLLGYRMAFRERLRGAEAVAAYLDGGTVFFTVTAALLLAFGPLAFATPGGTLVLAYAVFFLATAAATSLLALVMLVERRPAGTVAVLAALGLLGLSYIGRLLAGLDVGDRTDVPTNALLSVAALFGGYGAATWSDRRDDDPGYERLARRARAAIPLAAAALAPAILLLNGVALTTSDPVGTMTTVTVGLVLTTVMLRQSMLLRDREAAVERERRLTAELRAAEESYRSMVELVPAVIYVAELGPQGRWRYVSPRIESLLGFSAEEWTADPAIWMRQIHPDDRERVDAEERAHGERPGHASASEYRIFHRDGSELWVRDEAVIVADADGRPGWWRGVIVDITDRRRAEDALRDSEEQMRLVIDTASQAYVRMDAGGVVTEWNQQAEETFGWPRDDAVGKRLAELIVPPDQRAAHEAGLRRYLASGESTMLNKRVEVNALHRSGRQFPAELTIWAVRGAAGVQFSALVHDITVRKELETQLQHQAFHDALTGLANRALFADRVAHALTRLERRPRTALAVLFLDLDDFKTINDTLGHVAGDQVLAAVAERMRGALRPADTAARFGGDEFAVLIEETTRAGARRAAERLLQALRSPFDLQGRQVAMRGSIGIALSDGDSTSPDDLLRHADLAMYTAKGRGKGRIEFFEPEMHLAVVRRLELRSDLEQAIAAGELELHYQPIVNLRDGRLAALEALVRWRHPTQGIVEPGDFIPAAEENGLILPLGRWVVQAACAQLAAWDRACPPRDPDRPMGVTVNVSPRQLGDPQLTQTIVGALNAHGIDPNRLTLEITESALMEDIDACAAMLRALKRLGVRLAIDDFGTGYSALSYLERLPIDLLKIDGSFTSALGPGAEVPVLVRSIIKLGQTLRMEVLAEGIERPEQLARLRQLGCRLGQGFLFARPMPADAASELLEHRWPEALTA